MSSFRPRLVAVLGGAALLAALVASPGSVAANGVSTLYVGPGGGPGGCASPAYTDIQSAVDAAIDGDTVHVCAGTYNLVDTIGIPQTLSLVGDGAATTIVDGGSYRQLFYTDFGNTVSFTGLTLRNGDTGGDGGAIEGWIVNVTNCTVSDNSAEDDGGAIDAEDVSVTNSTFTGNDVYYGDGGAIHAYSSVTVAGSTFTGNETDWDDGGAIEASQVVVSNSTFSQNRADDDGGAIRAGSGTILNSTFWDNHGDDGEALHLGYTSTVSNSVFVGSWPQCRDSLLSGGGNVGTDDTCGGTVKTEAEIGLAPLANNGGPTQTMALGASSAAIGAGVGTICAAAPVSGKDQRGVPRPAGTRCDSGAFQRAAAFNPTPTIVSISPLSGKVGTTVTLTGANFTYVNAVTFNGVPALFQVRSPSAIVATVPAGATTGPIRLATRYLTSAQSPYAFVVLR